MQDHYWILEYSFDGGESWPTWSCHQTREAARKRRAGGIKEFKSRKSVNSRIRKFIPA